MREVAIRVVHLPAPVVAAIGWRHRATIEGRTIDAQAAAVLELDDHFGPGDLSRYSTEVTRRRLSRAMGLLDLEAAKDVRVRAIEVAGAEGRLAARHYVPAGLPVTSPLIVYFHGGGMVTGDLDSHDSLCRHLARRIRARVVAVDYRLAPEHPFPAAPEDAVAAFLDIARRATELGGDPTKLVVMGDSAGGNLSAVVAQRTTSWPLRPALQVLIYPATDLVGSFPSRRTFGDGFWLTGRLIDWFMDRYLPPGVDRRHPDASPLFREDVSGVAPALVYTAGFDPLRDEGQAYADKLSAAGVTVKYREFPSLLHGFAGMAGAIDAARQAVDLIAEDVSEALRSAGNPSQSTNGTTARRSAG
jgi:acetyl esterase